tara:strand:+ start:270 stop:734 length:465 start_codon:yes stop_codon:yes gene_type:complete
MTGQINVNKIAARTGTTIAVDTGDALTVDTLKGTATAGSINVVGEGNSNTTNLQQGLAKHWCQFVQSSATVTDSLNQASMTDHGAADTSWDFTTAMGNDNYSAQTTCNSGSWYVTSAYNDSTKTTAGDRCYTMKLNQTAVDASSVFVTTHGDLA